MQKGHTKDWVMSYDTVSEDYTIILCYEFMLVIKSFLKECTILKYGLRPIGHIGHLKNLP